MFCASVKKIKSHDITANRSICVLFSWMCEVKVIRGGSAICQFDVSAIMMKILHESFSSPCTWPANSDAFRRTHSLAIWNVDYLLFLTFACCDKYIPCRISAEEAKYARRGLVINKIHNTHTSICTQALKAETHPNFSPYYLEQFQLLPESDSTSPFKSSTDVKRHRKTYMSKITNVKLH